MKRQKIVIILLVILNIVVFTLFTLNWLDQQLELQLKEQKLKDEQFRLNQLMEKQDELLKVIDELERKDSSLYKVIFDNDSL